MRLFVAYSLLAATVVGYSTTVQNYQPTNVNYANGNAVLDTHGRQIGHTRKLIKPGSSNGGTTSAPVVTVPVSTTQPPPPPVETIAVSTTVAAFVPTATPYQIPEDSTPEVRNEVPTTTTTALNSDMYFKAPDMSIFTTASPSTTTVVVTESKTPPPETTTMVSIRADVTVVQENKVVTDNVPIAAIHVNLPVTYDTDELQRKGKDDKKPVMAQSINSTSTDQSSKKDNKNNDKSGVTTGNTEPKGSYSNIDAKRVYDSVLKAFNSVKTGLCFSPSELQKAFPNCKIMY